MNHNQLEDKMIRKLEDGRWWILTENNIDSSVTNEGRKRIMIY